MNLTQFSSSCSGASADLQSRSQVAERSNRHVTLPEIPEIVLSQSLDRNILFFKSTTAKLHVRHEGRHWSGHDDLILSQNDEDVKCGWYHTPELKQGDNELYDFVVIGKDRYNRIVILLLVWKDSVAYRRGLASLDATLWKRLENPDSKIICLG